MTSFEKFNLIPKDEFDRLRQHDLRTYDPKLRVLACLDQEMTEILNRTDISPEEKMTNYQQAQHRFMALFKTISPAMLAAAQEPESGQSAVVAGAAAAPAAAAAAAAPNEDDEFFNAQTSSGPSMHSFVKHLNLPPNREPKAFNLMENIQKHPSLIAFDSNDQLVLNNRPIVGSKFSELFRELYVHSKSHNIHGLEPFMRALHALHISPTAISNTSLHSYLTPTPPSQIGKGRRPPGKVSNILRLYRI